jgi:N-acetylglutamate synthase-like GNAT family acetyltransferase
MSHSTLFSSPFGALSLLRSSSLAHHNRQQTISLLPDEEQDVEVDSIVAVVVVVTSSAHFFRSLGRTRAKEKHLPNSNLSLSSVPYSN